MEVSCRTLQGRYLLKPSAELRALIVGILARAQRLYPLEVCAVAFLSNHYHLLLQVPDAQAMAGFMGYVNANLALEAGRLHGWEGPFWATRYRAIPVSDEEEAQVARLKYLLAQGCKEGLVARPQDWPGLHSAEALTTEETLSGHWVDRTRMALAHPRGSRVEPEPVILPETLTLSPLPCWRHYPATLRRRLVGELLEQIEEETATEHRRQGTQAAGAERVLSMRPHDRPSLLARSPAPAVHAHCRAIRQQMIDAYRCFVLAYEEAAGRLRRGDRQARFPEGCFPPALPFVPVGGREPP